MIKDLGILDSNNKLQTILVIWVQAIVNTFIILIVVSYFDNVICFYTFGKWFLYYTFLNQNASQISQTNKNFCIFQLKILNRSARFVRQIIPAWLLNAL